MARFRQSVENETSTPPSQGDGNAEARNTLHLQVGGMSCSACQRKVQKALAALPGAISASVSWVSGAASVAFEDGMLDELAVREAILNAGYEPLAKPAPGSAPGTGALLVLMSGALFFLLRQAGLSDLFNASALGGASALVAGLASSMHCVAMCGGFGLSAAFSNGNARSSQPGTFSSIVPAISYNFGRVVSYTLVGAILGFAGSALGISGGLGQGVQAILKLVAGVFMLAMGVNMLGIFPKLRSIAPSLPPVFSGISQFLSKGKRTPFAIGLANGLMPCGPLQSMQIAALASVSWLAGASFMAMFALGTLPAPLLFSVAASRLAASKKRYAQITALGATLVVAFGLSMLAQAAGLSGMISPELIAPVFVAACLVGILCRVTFATLARKLAVTGVTAMAMAFAIGAYAAMASMPGNGAYVQGGAVSYRLSGGEQIIESDLASGRFPDFTVQAGIPVRWTVNASPSSINGCNSRILINAFGIEHTFKPGANVLTFTPTQAGVYRYSCWMGMITASITVTDGPVEPSPTGTGQSQWDPVEANVKIPTGDVQVSQPGIDSNGMAESSLIALRLDSTGFHSPVYVVAYGSSVTMTVSLDFGPDREGDGCVFFPMYSARWELAPGENSISFVASDSFEFYDQGARHFGYVKVMRDPASLDLDELVRELSSFETLVYPAGHFIDVQDGMLTLE